MRRKDLRLKVPLSCCIVKRKLRLWFLTDHGVFSSTAPLFWSVFLLSSVYQVVFKSLSLRLLPQSMTADEITSSTMSYQRNLIANAERSINIHRRKSLHIHFLHTASQFHIQSSLLSSWIQRYLWSLTTSSFSPIMKFVFDIFLLLPKNQRSPI